MHKEHGFRLAVVGSRLFKDYEIMVEWIGCQYHIPSIDMIISGGARGADKLAREYDIPIIIFKADWSRNGKYAGFLRNKIIANNCTHLTAFWDGKSRGTAQCRDYAWSIGVDVKTLYFEASG